MEEDFKVPDFLPQPPRPEAKQEEPELPYKVPKWNGPKPEQNYSFEVLKNGVIIDEVKDLQNKPYWMIGRLPVGAGIDISAAHPTVSRYHAVLQYKDPSSAQESEGDAQKGWYIYDLDSTHGTFINKMRIKPRIYVRVKVGFQLKLGNSTRNYILQGPTEDEEEESEFTITELKQQKADRELELKQKEIDEQLEREKKKKDEQEAGISWGMAEDAEEEPDLSVNPFAVTNNEELFLDDPKKTLRGFFEREGYDLEYRCEELSPGVFICKVELPVDDEYGKNIICEVQHKGKKKECVIQCALESCRILDRHGVLRQANHEPRRAKKMENSDSDDDNFFDRTGDVEKKRLKKLGAAQNEAFTYEQLMEQEKEMIDKIQTKEHKLKLMVQIEKRQRNETEEDLDAFMSNLSSMDSKVDKFAISSLKMEIQTLKIEHQKVQKLINIAKPSITLPPIAAGKGKLPLFGKRNSLGRNILRKSEPVAVVKNDEATTEVEEEEDEADENPSSEKLPEEDKLENTKVVSSMKIAEEKTDEKKIEPTIADPPIPSPETSEKLSKLAAPSTTKPTSSFKEDPSEPVEKKVKLDQQESIKESTQDTAAKKRKSRVRIRNRLRENVDINDDDEYIDEEKISTWVAPVDQTGDGTTHLNDKYGY